jgi:hypothetical protein
LDAWPIIFIGWPAIIASLALLGYGIVTQGWKTTLAGSLIALPFLLYLFATPRFRYLAPVLILLNFAAVLAVSRGHRWLPAALVVPFFGTTAWLAYAVSSQ